MVKKIVTWCEASNRITVLVRTGISYNGIPVYECAGCNKKFWVKTQSAGHTTPNKRRKI